MAELSIDGDHQERLGCAYILSDLGARRVCGAPARSGSSYCGPHHALCHVSSGTAEEVIRMREVEVLANAVGGRRARPGTGPSRQFLRRLEHTLRGFS